MPKPSIPGKKPTVDLDGWLSFNRLSRHEHPDFSCFHRMAGQPIIGSPSDSSYGCAGKDCDVSGSVLDRPHRFRINGTNSIADYAGVIAAPYLHSHEIQPYAQRLSDQFGLAYRIGKPDDDWFGYGTTPIVIWNPRMITL